MSLAALIHAGWHLAARAEARAFAHACQDIRAAQAEVLAGVLREAAPSAYGRRYGLGETLSWDEYRARIPLVSPDSLAPWTARVAEGEASVLTASPVRLLEPTSGTASGTRLVPYTASLRRAFGRAVSAWMGDVLGRYPGVRRGPAYWSVSPPGLRPSRTPGGVPVGFADDAGYLGGLAAPIVRKALAVPPAVRGLAHPEAFRYATLHALLARPDLALVSVWNPTFLSVLLGPLRAWGDALVRDLAEGTLTLPGGHPAPPALRRGLGPRPRLARRVGRALAEAGADAALTAALWPRLALVSAWADASAAEPARALRALLPHAAFQPKGLLATEGVVSIPWRDGPGAVLAVRSHAYEFEADDDGRAGQTRLAHELTPGETYRVVISTQGGLYRYRLGDRVRVVGFEGEAPRLVFVGRAGTTSDHVGEKLDEAHVGPALHAALAGVRAEASFALVALAPPAEAGEPPGYALFAQTEASAEALREAARALDVALHGNVHYAHARRLGQLGPVRAFRIRGGGPEAYLQAGVGRGQGWGTIKPALLHRAADWAEAFEGAFV